jgi:hypothetical protein
MMHVEQSTNSICRMKGCSKPNKFCYRIYRLGKSVQKQQPSRLYRNSQMHSGLNKISQHWVQQHLTSLQSAVNTTNGAGGQVSPSNSMAPVRELLCNFSFSVKTKTMQAKMSDALKLERSTRKRYHEQAIPNSRSPESSVGTVPESILSNSATSAVSRGNERKAKNVSKSSNASLLQTYQTTWVLTE